MMTVDTRTDKTVLEDWFDTVAYDVPVDGIPDDPDDDDDDSDGVDR